MNRTQRVISSTPAQASCCHSEKGLIANLKIVTGKLAIGSFKSVLQTWFDSEVKINGAVSPAIRAIANQIPVIMPDIEAFKVILDIIFHFGVPSA